LSIALNEPLQNAGHSTDVISPKPPDVENKSAAPSKLGKSIILPANDTNDDSKNSPRGSILSLQSNRDQKQHSTTDKRSTSTLADAHTIVEYRDTNRQLATYVTRTLICSTCVSQTLYPQLVSRKLVSSPCFLPPRYIVPSPSCRFTRKNWQSGTCRSNSS